MDTEARTTIQSGSGKTLRPYQQETVDAVLAGNLDTVICLPTGAGKTVIASAVMDQLEGTKVFIVPRLELIKQARDEFGDVDVIWADKTSLTGKDVIISSKDSLRTQHQKIPRDKKLTLIFDEAHVGIEQTHKLVSLLKPDRTLGLTATPERMDGKALTKGIGPIHKFGVFDNVLVAETVPTLIEKGYLTPLSYYTKPIEGIADIKPDNALSEELSDEQMMRIFDENEIWGDLVRCYEQYNPEKKPAIGFTRTISMAEGVCRLFTKAGYDFRVISGDMPVSERRQLLDGLRDGKIDGLVNAALLTYGFDMPEASYLFSCRHIKSRPLWFQMVGRALRVCEGKDRAIFVDHGDSISEFATPDCALPILDPFIEWRYDGLDKEKKRMLKAQQKKANDAIKIIEDMDPLPVSMVEITPEHLFDRLIRIITNVQKENGSLRDLIVKSRESEAEAMKTARESAEAAKRARREAYSAKEAKAAAEKEIERAKYAVNALMNENEVLKKKKATPKTIDANKTFEHIRRNYCLRRREFEAQGIHGDEAHKKVVESFLKEKDKLDFFYDEFQFKKGMGYWRSHYGTR